MASKIAMGVNFTLGAVVTGLALNMMEKTRKCTDIGFQRSLEGILVVSVSILVASIAYIICHMKCGCDPGESPFTRTMFALYFILLGIILIVLGAIVQAKASDKCSDAKAGATATWILGVVVVLASVGYFVAENREYLASVAGGMAKGMSKKSSPK